MRWIQRLTCMLEGHHDLCLAAAYGARLPGGSGKELHYCARCGRAVWTSPGPDGPSPPPRWADSGEARLTVQGVSLLKRGAWCVAVGGVLFAATLVHAQVEALDPNPLEPEGVGAHIGLETRYRGSGDAASGRAVGDRADHADEKAISRRRRGLGFEHVGGRAIRAEENATETMPRDLERTNYGRRTSHAMRGAAVRTAPRGESRYQPPPRGAGGAVHSARRDRYDHARYAPRAGVYPLQAPRRAPAARTRPRWY